MWYSNWNKEQNHHQIDNGYGGCWFSIIIIIIFLHLFNNWDMNLLEMLSNRSTSSPYTCKPKMVCIESVRHASQHQSSEAGRQSVSQSVSQFSTQNQKKRILKNELLLIHSKYHAMRWYALRSVSKWLLFLITSNRTNSKWIRIQKIL